MRLLCLGLLLQLQQLFAASVPGSSQCSCGQPRQGQVLPAHAIIDAMQNQKAASAGRWCWQVALQNEAGTVFCSATLIDASYAITPAQCVFGRQANSTFVRLGAFDIAAPGSDFTVVPVSDLLIHQGYLNIDSRNDFNIAVIRLSTPLDCSSNSVCFACLPEVNAPLTGETSCLATSWNFRKGSMDKVPSQTLRDRPAAIMDQMECEMRLRADKAIENDYHLSDNKFCLMEAQNGTTCMGDLGDPLVCQNSNTMNTTTARYEIVGLNTLGFSCFRTNLPSFYIRISNFVDWINKLREQPGLTSLPSSFQPARQPQQQTQTSGLIGVLVAPVSLVLPTSVPSASPVVVAAASNEAAGRAFVPLPSTSTPITTTSTTTRTTTTTTTPTTTTTTTTETPTAVPVVLVAPGSDSPTNTGLPAMGHMTPIGIQRFTGEGSLLQVGVDGSLQTQQGLRPMTPMLQQVSPGVFRTNIAGQTHTIDLNRGPAIILPNAAGNQQRQKRSGSVLAVSTANSGSGSVIGPNLSSNLNIPTVNVQASDVAYNAQTGKFEFRLPTGQSAVSAVSFAPSNQEDIKNQIIAQQDRILAQVQQANNNILIAISNAFPGQFSAGTGAFTGINTGAGPSTVLTSANSNAGSSVTNVGKASVLAPKNFATTSLEDEDSSEEVQPVQTAVVRPGVVRGNANAAGSIAPGVHSGPTPNGGFRATVNHNTPSQGSLRTSLNTANSQNTAALGFKGDRVIGETRNSPGSAMSSVSASSNGRR